MKNKKGSVDETVWYVVICIILLLVICCTLLYKDKPHFTAYKEECGAKEIFLREGEIIIELADNNSKYVGRYIEDINSTLYYRFYEKVCQNVSVDKIGINKTAVCLGNEVYCDGKTPHEFFDDIKVKDLKEDWLNYYCECSELCYKSYCENIIPDKLSKLELDEEDCIKWKCQDTWVVKA
jgi:hypothetical protein